jgi:hypothetical protein
VWSSANEEDSSKVIGGSQMLTANELMLGSSVFARV